MDNEYEKTTEVKKVIKKDTKVLSKEDFIKEVKKNAPRDKRWWKNPPV